MSARFKLNFNNNNSYSQSNYYNNVAPLLANAPKILVSNKNQALHAPMIGRVYNAKPGCSSCGKKVA
jgi:hypothetical protein